MKTRANVTVWERHRERVSKQRPRERLIPRKCPPKGLGTLLERRTDQERIAMLFTIALVLLVLWALGLVTSYTVGGFIHILLVAAIVLVLVRVIQGRRPL
jgi:hypothetical protein